MDSSVTLSTTLLLPYRSPYDWAAMLAYFTARAIPGVEYVAEGVYRRTLAHDGVHGTVAVAHHPDRNALSCTIRCPGPAALTAEISARVRRVFDVDADVATIGGHLSRDRMLAALVARRPGLRVPGGWDTFELAIRAVLGQQVTLAAACALARRLVLAAGTPIIDTETNDPRLTHLFPEPATVAANDLLTLGMPGARRAALHAIARAALEDSSPLAPASTLTEAIARLRSIQGIGEWTAHYTALRAHREPDAFPASDIGLRRAAADAAGLRPSPAALMLRAEAWRPFRAYAAQHLWAADAATLARAREQEYG